MHNDKNSTAEDKDGFIIVKSRNRRKGNNKGKGYSTTKFHHDIVNTLTNLGEREETERREEVLKKIETCVQILEEEGKFYSSLLENLDITFQEVFGTETDVKIRNILCLGLGPFSSHSISKPCRFQLGLLILLKRRFNCSVEVFDPAFISQEKLILKEDFGFKVSDENKEGKYCIERPTLVFLPHCPHELVISMMDQSSRVKLISILRSIYRELRHYDFGPGVGVRKSGTWKYIMETARRNRVTALQNCQEGNEWPRIAETYLMYTQSSRIYADMIDRTKKIHGGKTLIDAIKSQSKASSVLFELKRRKSDRNKIRRKDKENPSSDNNDNENK